MPSRVPIEAGQGLGPRPLMLGKGWFPEQIGGLDRYYHDLLDHLPEARGVVIGAGSTTPTRVTAVSDHGRPLARRIFAYWRATQRAGAEADVVDSHFALYAIAPLFVGRLRGRRSILHFHGPWAEENIAAGDSSPTRRLARRLLERAAYSRVDHAIVLSSAFRQVLVERYGVQPWSITVEPPGVDLDRFSLGSVEHARWGFGLAPDAFVAVAVRRLVARMGLDVLLGAWADALPDLPPDSRLLIAGDGPLRSALDASILKRGIESSVVLLGRISDERLVELYRAADIAVVPTIEHEGFGMAVLEAAACGAPSLVTDVGGLPEAIAQLDPSLIVPPADQDALRDRLLRSRVERPSREAARGYAERYRWSDVADRHRAIARRVVSGAASDRALRVVYLDHVAKLSGGEIALLRLLPHLERVHPHVILAEDGPLVRQLHLAGISTEVIPFAQSVRELRKADVGSHAPSPTAVALTAAYVARLALRLKRLDADLVHTNSLKAGVYGSLAARLAGTPVVWHVRDRISADYLPPAAVTVVRRMSRHLANAVVANSHSTLATVATPDKSSVVLYSVLPEVMTDVPRRERRAQGALTFGIVGRLAPWKGQDLFLRAFADAFPSGPERAVVVGGALFGEDDYASSLSRLAESLGLGGRVEFRGHRPDVWDELSRIDVLVHASITPEPFGQVILEGMAAGVPVIAARAGGPAEILDDNLTGILYEPASVVDLQRAMCLMQDPALRERLAAEARNRLGRYAPSVVAAELEDLYSTVVGRDSVGRVPTMVPGRSVAASPVEPVKH